MSFRGSLKTLALSDILQTLAMNSQSGVLRLVRKPGGAVRLICFEGGEVRNVARGAAGRSVRAPREKPAGRANEKGASPVAEELPPLVAYMVGRRLLTPEQAATLVKQMAGSDAPAARLIAELGYAAEGEIAHLVKRFCEEEVYDVFTWDDADFEFADGAPEQGAFSQDAPSCGVRLPTGSLVMEAARRIDEWGRFRQTLPSGREVLVAADLDAAAQLPAAIEGLDPVMHRVLSLADGTRDIDDLIVDSWLSRYEAGGILCFLIESGRLRSAAVADLERAGAALSRSQNWARLGKLYERLLALGQDTPAIRTKLAEAATKAGDVERAAIHMGVLADQAVEQGREGQAVELWQRILELLPRNLRAHQALAEHHKGHGRRDESLKHYTALVRAQIAAGAHDRAIAAAQAASEEGKEDPRTRSLLADALIAAGRAPEAVGELEIAAEELAGSGDVRAACETLRRVLQIEPGRESARKRLAALLSMEDRRRHVRGRVLAVAVPVVLILAAVVVLLYYDFKVARPRFDQACSEAARYVALAEQEAREQRHDEAVSALRKACDAYDRARQTWLVTGGTGLADDERMKCLVRIDELQGAKIELERGIASRAAEIRKEAEDCIAAGKLEDARQKLLMLERAGRESDQDFARRELTRINACLEEIGEATRKVGRYASEQEEFESVLRLSRKYPSNPAILALTFPVQVESDPSGAEVRLNDLPSSMTPCTVRMSVAGPNRLVMGHRGYAEVQITPTIGEVPASRTIRRELARVPAWKVRVDAAVEAPLVLVPGKGRIVFGDRAGNLHCLSAGDGAEVWKRPLGALASVTGAATIDGDAVYVGSFDSRVYAVSLADGKDLWPPFKTEGLLRAAPRLAAVQLLNNQRFLFVGSDDGCVYCLDAGSGEQRWKSAKMGAVSVPVLVAAEAVYAASDDERVHALSITDGREIWNLKLGAALRSAPAIHDGILYVGSDDGCLYAVDLERHEVRWRQQARGGVRSGPVLAGSQLYFASMEGEVWALEPSAARPGAVRQWGLAAAASAAPLVTEKRIYIGSHDGWFHALDRASDKEIWRFKTAGGAIHSSAVWCDGMVIVGADDGFVYAFDEK